ncbi:MAG: Mrp/NBP35 family ATP-binding protein [Planctomycetota bacterium]
MSFDKARVLEEIQSTLTEIPLPGSPGNVVQAGLIQRVIAHEGEITLVVEFPPELVNQQGSISERLEEEIGRIDGVSKVTVLHKKPEDSQAESGDQGSPAQGAQGPGPNTVGAQDIPGVKHVIAVASGKGGVGKSTVAVNLALALQKIGKKVGLLDADVYGPSTPKMLGTEEVRPHATERETILPIESHGLQTMSIGYLLEEDSPVIWRGPMVTGLLRQFLFQVEWGDLDFLVLDLPPGTGDAQLTLVQSLSLAGGVIVTTPQDVALLDVQRGIQMFQRTSVPILGVIENMSHFECPQCQHVTEIFPGTGGEEISNRYGVPFLGKIPLEPTTALQGDSGVPVMVQQPDGALASTMLSIAHQMSEALVQE